MEEWAQVFLWRHRKGLIGCEPSKKIWESLRERVVPSAVVKRKFLCVKMPDSSVFYGCRNTANPENEISVRSYILFWGDSRPECVTRRKVWVDFVKRRWAKWKPTENSKIREDFARLFLNLPAQERQSCPTLLTDNLGLVCIWRFSRTTPNLAKGTKHLKCLSGQEERCKNIHAANLTICILNLL